MQLTHARRLVDAEVPEADVLRRARRNLAQVYSDEEIIGALQEAVLGLTARA